MSQGGCLSPYERHKWTGPDGEESNYCLRCGEPTGPEAKRRLARQRKRAEELLRSNAASAGYIRSVLCGNCEHPLAVRETEIKIPYRRDGSPTLKGECPACETFNVRRVSWPMCRAILAHADPRRPDVRRLRELMGVREGGP